MDILKNGLRTPRKSKRLTKALRTSLFSGLDEAVFFTICESCPWIIIEVSDTSQKKLLCGFSSRELLSGDIILKGSELSRACARTGLAFTNLRPCCARLTNRQHGTSCLTTTTRYSVRTQDRVSDQGSVIFFCQTVLLAKTSAQGYGTLACGDIA